MKPHEIKWITGSQTLRMQTSLSLIDRCKYFQKEFPTAKMNPTLLRQVYAIHGIKKKKLRWQKFPKERNPDKEKQQLTTMKREMTKAKNLGYRFVYIDETCFTRKTC